MALSSSTLYNSIKSAAENAIAAHQTQTVEVKTYKLDNGDIVEGTAQTSSEFPSGVDGVKALIDIIAKAVAEEVVSHIQSNLSLIGGKATFSGETVAGTWIGVGGGVTGPVTSTSGSGIAGTQTLSITEGKFK